MIDFRKILGFIVLSCSLFAVDDVQLNKSQVDENKNVASCCEPCKACETSNKAESSQVKQNSDKCCGCSQCQTCESNDQSSCCSICCQKQDTDIVADYLESSRIKGKDWNIQASFIYWFASEDNLDAGLYIKETQLALLFGGGNINNVSSELIKVPFSYNPGFRVGVGFNLCHDEWSLNFKYQRYYVEQSHELSVPQLTDFTALTEVIFPAWIANGVLMYDAGYNEVKNKWHLGTDIVDIELDRQFNVGKCLSLRPYFGVRTGSINQKYNLIYNGSAISSVPGLIAISNKSNNKTNSWILGPKAGLDTTWRLTRSLNFIGCGALSLFYQHVRASIKNPGSYPTVNSDVIQVDFNANKVFHRVSGSFDGSLGFQTGDCFCNRYMSLAVTYDFSIYFHQNLMRTLMNNSNVPAFLTVAGGFSQFTSDNCPGNLMLHGLTITAKVDF